MLKNKSTNIDAILYKIPIGGILCFIALYFYASTLYPGGSQADLKAEGFSWMHNYWCNLLNVKAMNGQLNPARPFGIAAMLLLCFSLAVFFFQFGKMYASNITWKRIIQFNGAISMIFASFIFTSYHDLMTILSSIFGLFVVIGIVKEVYQNKMLNYQISGILCILLLGLNNYIYYSQNYIALLPLLQKITFAIVLVWVLALSITLKSVNK